MSVPLLTVWLGRRRAVALRFVVLVAVGLVPVLSRGTAWVGSWKMALDWATFSLTLLGPAAAGMACAAYVRLTGSGVDALMLTGPRPVVAWLRPAASIWAVGAAAVVLICMLATGAASIAGSPAYPSSYWVILPALCVLAAQVAVGMALGGAGRRRWLVPVAVALTFGLGILTAVGAIAHVFRTGGVTGPLVGQTFDGEALVLQGISALGLAAALVVVANWPGVRAHRAPRLALPSVMVAGLAAYVLLASGDYDRYVASDEIDFVCAGDGPEVCMARETTRPLDDLSARVGRQAEALRRVGAAVPSRFVQLAPGRDVGRGDGVVDLTVEQALAASVSDEAAARVLTLPALCPQYVADVGPPAALFEVQRLLTRWLLHHDGVVQVTDSDEDAVWLRRDISHQAAWVRTTYDLLRSCQIDSVRLPRVVG